MTNNYAQVLKRVAWTLIVAGLPAGTTLAAGKNCADLAALPAVVEVGEGMQTAMRSPEAITRLAIGDPKSLMCTSMAMMHTCLPVLLPEPPA